jgi:hypothetical protein
MACVSSTTRILRAITVSSFRLLHQPKATIHQILYSTVPKPELQQHAHDGATSPTSRSSVEVGKWARYLSNPRSKWISKKRVSLVGEGKIVCLHLLEHYRFTPPRGIR